jgi:hypothetical protein
MLLVVPLACWSYSALAAGKLPCLQGGCRGQLCIEADADVPSSCEPSPLYACYNDVGHCERQADGTCGWTQTPELRHCMDTAGHAHLLQLPGDHDADPED